MHRFTFRHRQGILFASLLLGSAIHTTGAERRGAAVGWKKHVVHAGHHTNTAVAADFTGDGRVDIISNSGGKTRLFVAPARREIVLDPDAKHDCIHGAILDVDGDGDPDFLGARYSSGLVFWLERPKHPESDRWRYHLVDDQVQRGTRPAHRGRGRRRQG